VFVIVRRAMKANFFVEKRLFCFNRIPVMPPILVPLLGVHFFRGIFPSKMGRFAPFLATIQRLSKTCAFLSKKRSGGFFLWAVPSLLLSLNMWFVSWESTPARVKASKRGAKCYPREEYLA
jgi:hypothetical protein